MPAYVNDHASTVLPAPFRAWHAALLKSGTQVLDVFFFAAEAHNRASAAFHVSG